MLEQPRCRSARVVAPRHRGARSRDPLAFVEMTQDDQDVESHHVVVREISPFGIELIVIADIYSCFLCGA